MFLEDGAAGSKGQQGWQPGGMAGMEEEKGAPAARTEGMEGIEGLEGMEGKHRGGLAYGAWELPARLHSLSLFHGPARGLEGFGKIHVFQDITPKETYSACVCAR